MREKIEKLALMKKFEFFKDLLNFNKEMYDTINEVIIYYIISSNKYFYKYDIFINTNKNELKCEK